ncbi:membrane protein insertase YidC [Streptomyces sp. NPDC005438]|uniref:YidC/Oxa1 family membrane protein insertase n=1 Tax=Streptomyces sp. NPDC005438 TaxID=3156880 RepID=UPI0033B41424
MSTVASLVASLSDALAPLFGASATAAAIVLSTLLVRLALHPLARSAVRGQRASAEVAPRYAELQRRHRDDPERLRREAQKLYAESGSSPFAGCLPTLIQMPVFGVMYHLFVTDQDLLRETLWGAPLGGRFAQAWSQDGPLHGQGLVYLGLFAVLASVACWNFLRARRQASARERAGTPVATGSPTAGLGRWLPLLSFGTLVSAAVLPLAAGLYLVTTTTWTAVERAALRAGEPV